MRCQLYLMADEGRPTQIGPMDAIDDAHARELAVFEMSRRPNIHAIDVWCESGELFRVDRPSNSGPAVTPNTTPTAAYPAPRPHG